MGMMNSETVVSSKHNRQDLEQRENVEEKRRLQESLDGKQFQGENINIGYPLRFNPSVHKLMVKIEKFPVVLKRDTGVLTFNDSAYNLNLSQARQQPNPQLNHPPIVYLYVPEYSAYITRVENHFDIANKLDFYLGYVNQQFYMEKDEHLPDHYHFRLANMDELNQQYMGQGDSNDERVYAYSQKSNLTRWNMTYDLNTSSYEFQFAGVQVHPNTSIIMVDDLQNNHLSWLMPYKSSVLRYSSQQHPIYSTVLFNQTTLSSKAKLHHIIHHYHHLPPYTAFVSSDALTESSPTSCLALELMTTSPSLLPPLLPLSWFNRQQPYPPVLELVDSPIITHNHHHYSLYPQQLQLNFSDSSEPFSNNVYKQQYYPQIMSLSSSPEISTSIGSPFEHLLELCNCTLSSPSSTFMTTPAPHFIVNKASIQQHPLSFYKCLHHLYTKHSQHALAIDLTLKDMWLLIFNYNNQFTFHHK